VLIAVPATHYMEYSPSKNVYTSRFYFTEVSFNSGKFGKWVIDGNYSSRFKVDAFDEASVEEGRLESMCALCQNGLDEVKEDGGTVVCIVQERSEMPAYRMVGLRKRFNLLVYIL